ncbi:MAG: hypothetical protein WBG11_02325 [Methylocella sp.]
MSAGAAMPDAAPRRPVIVAPSILAADFGRLAEVIEVDGGRNWESAGQAIEAGASAIVAGSAILGSPDYAAAIIAIRAGRRPPAGKAYA